MKSLRLGRVPDLIEAVKPRYRQQALARNNISFVAEKNPRFAELADFKLHPRTIVITRDGKASGLLVFLVTGIDHDIGIEYVRNKLRSVSAFVRGVDQFLRRRNYLGNSGNREEHR